ncbi:MAG: NifU family protein [Marmoricola sp.]
MAEEPTDWREVGQRIESLLDASSAGGAAVRERAETLAGLLTDLYGAGLGRIMDLLRDAGVLDEGLERALVADDLVANLLLIHGLHPHDVPTRVEAALDSVRPYLGSHEGDVELLEVTDDGVVQLRLLGSCDGCPSSTVTLQTAVEDAIRSAAPEVTGIEVEEAQLEGEGAGGRTLISVDSLRSRLGAPSTGDSSWSAVPEMAELLSGEIGGFAVEGRPVFACRLDDTLYAYADRCPDCMQGMAGATLGRRAGASRVVVLTCPHCHSHYDVRHAGAGLDGDAHLQPLPLVVKDGVPSLALPSGAAAP